MVMVAVLAAGPGAAVTGKTAAALHRIRGYLEGGPIEIAQPRRPSRRYKVANEHSATRLPAHHIRLVDGIPTATVERTTFELCRSAGMKRAEQVIKAVVGAKLTTFDKLVVILEECGGRGCKGTRVFRALLATLMYEPSITELEALVNETFDAAGMERWDREVNVGGMETPVGRVDFLRRPYGVVVEADSKQWHGEWLHTVADQRRTALLTAAGYHVVHTNWAQLKTEPEVFIAAVRGAIRRAA